MPWLTVVATREMTSSSCAVRGPSGSRSHRCASDTPHLSVSHHDQRRHSSTSPSVLAQDRFRTPRDWQFSRQTGHFTAPARLASCASTRACSRACNTGSVERRAASFPACSSSIASCSNSGGDAAYAARISHACSQPRTIVAEVPRSIAMCSATCALSCAPAASSFARYARASAASHAPSFATAILPLSFAIGGTSWLSPGMCPERVATQGVPPPFVSRQLCATALWSPFEDPHPDDCSMLDPRPRGQYRVFLDLTGLASRV